MKLSKQYDLCSALLILLGITFFDMPVWVAASSAIIIFSRFAFEFLNLPPPPSIISTLLGAVWMLIVYLKYRTFFGQQESVILCVGIISLTILNYSTNRDRLFLILMGFLLLSLESMQTIELYWLPPMLTAFFLLWWSLLQLKNLKFLVKIVGYSIPLSVALFLLFPRWVIFKTSQTSQTIGVSGFVDEVRAGQLLKVALSDQTVFRVEFENHEFNPNELYWRGATLSDSDGLHWKKNAKLDLNSTVKSIVSTDRMVPIKYSITLEPTEIRNIFLLEQPLKVDSSSIPVAELNSQVFRLAEPARKTVKIFAVSSLEYLRNENLNNAELQEYLKIPILPPKTSKLADSLKSKSGDPTERIRELRKFFKNNGFLYTLEINSVVKDLDEFIFQSREGFCEHFAASFATLARALDVPSRIVVGYQGGRLNVLGDYWRISQRDAHAWVELFIDGRWQREDPTEYVNPIRIALGGQQYFSLSESELESYAKTRGLEIQNAAYMMWLHVNAVFDQLNYLWVQFLLGYDIETQMKFLNDVSMAWGFGLAFLTLLGVWSIFRFRQILSCKKNDKTIGRLVSQIEEWAVSRNVEILPSHSPIQALHHIQEKFPELQDILIEITEEYRRVTYMKRNVNRIDIKTFRHLESSWRSQTKKLSKKL